MKTGTWWKSFLITAGVMNKCFWCMRDRKDSNGFDCQQMILLSLP